MRHNGNPTHPLTPAQERLWFLQRLDPADPSYNICYTDRVRGRLDVPALAAAFTVAVDRHETLRTRFPEVGGRPVATVEPGGPVVIERRSAAGVAQARELLSVIVHTPFDLAGPPPLRVVLVELGPEDHVLCVVLHHINGDGASLGVLRAEVATGYRGQRPAPLPVRYGDLAAGGPDPADLDWWAGRLAGAPVLELPTDRPRPAVRSGAGGAVDFTVPAELGRAVAGLARQARCTPFMVLLTAFQVLLARHSGQRDLCVGIPTAGRADPDLEPLVGCFATTLVLRGDVPAELPFADLLRRTRTALVEALSHPDAPLELLLERLGPARDLSRTPLFQTMFTLHPPDEVTDPLPGLEVTRFPTVWHAARCDLSVELWPAADGGLIGSAIHSAELFDPDTVTRLAARYLTLLASAVADPAAPVGTLPMLPAGEVAQLSAWNRTATAIPATTLPELVLAQAAATPSATAVVAGPVRLSYAELAGRVTAVAAWLGTRGVGPGSLVALRLPYGVDLLTAMLGVCVLGAAYLPVDPGYPELRVAGILADARPDLVLDQVPAGLPSGAEVPVRARPAGAAYVLYTSGSTGRPKGVVVPHRALVNLLLAMRDLLGATPRDGWLGLTSVSFDISAVELYLPLVTGGRVVLCPPGTGADAAALGKVVRAAGVTHVQATPSGWRVLEAAGLPPGITALCGGEALPPAQARRLRSRFGRVVNVYGPTETTVWSAAWEVPAEPAEVLIGGPLANTTLRVLDGSGRECPVGVPGELFIGGAGVADGYLRRPGGTAERFVPDPWGPPGARGYRTGDLVRRRARGALEFLGRADHQVKLRGHRLELGEVETVVAAVPGVEQAVAAVRDDRLVVYVVGPATAEDVQAHARARLPGYAVPAEVLTVPSFPLTPNGKVDRAALPSVPAPAGAPGRAATAAETVVAAAFAQVLGRAEVGAGDDFFALGGHSLLATEVTARIAELTGVTLPMRALFAAPTVAALATRLGDATGEAQPVDLPVPGPQPLSYAQERLWLLDRIDPNRAAYNVVRVLRLRGSLDRAALDGALAGVAAAHDALRTRFPERDGAPLAVVEAPGPVAVETVHAATEAAAERIVAARTNAPLDLADRPPLAVTLIELAPDDHVLCLVAHHITVDGTSSNLIEAELADRYSGREPAPAPGRFGPFAAWQRGRDTTGLLAHWTRELAGVPDLALPTDRPAPEDGTRRGTHASFRLGPERVEALGLLGREHGASPFMVLVAAYQVLLARHTGQEDFAVGTVTSGRDRPRWQRLVGDLTETLVLRADLSGDPTLGEFLRRTRARVLDAFAHHGLPFERLAARLRAGRDPTRAPLFQTMAILHTEERGCPAGAFAGLTATPFEHGWYQAKLELTLEAWPEPDGGLSVALVYDAELFEAATARGLAARLELLLTALPDHAGTPLSALPVVTAADEAWLGSLGEGPARSVPAPVGALVAETVRRTPEAIAIGSAGWTVTYRELDTGSGALAARLRADGVRAGDVVGVCLRRGPDLIAALLAVWRVGAAYLPLDPSHPRARRELMIRDSGAVSVLTDAAGTPSTLDTLDTVAGELAYVCYTSGSTGTPKGVLVTQRGLAARVAWMVEHYGLTPSDRVVQFASLSFDTHAEEIFPALVAGARVELLPDGAATLPDLLATEAGREVTVLDLPTSYWHALVDQLDQVAWPAGLRLVILGGEQVQRAAVDRWLARFGDRVTLLNTYGPTETTVIATAAELSAGTGRPPIGRPIGATRVRVLDAHGRPVPPGAPGELHIGGAGVALGYTGDPARTADRFGPDAGGGRSYRTGDRVRWRCDGQLEFLGRLDEQTKVRGHRIEPGEIEARLREHPSAGQVAVAVHADTLVGYLTGTAAPAELAHRLATQLPEFMVPTLWMRLDTLPVTPAGKLDRAALPAPDPGPGGGYVAPRGAAEELVAEVFAEVLGAGRVGAFDDFFELGGHSLMATRVAARLGASTGVRVPIRTVFTERTTAALAAAVEELLISELDGLTDEEAAALLEPDPTVEAT